MEPKQTTSLKKSFCLKNKISSKQFSKKYSNLTIEFKKIKWLIRKMKKLFQLKDKISYALNVMWK